MPAPAGGSAALPGGTRGCVTLKCFSFPVAFRLQRKVGTFVLVKDKVADTQPGTAVGA